MAVSVCREQYANYSTDLGSLNIMRGREHGIPSYNKWRQFCGLPVAKSFDDLKDTMLDSNIRNALATNYQSTGMRTVGG